MVSRSPVSQGGAIWAAVLQADFTRSCWSTCFAAQGQAVYDDLSIYEVAPHAYRENAFFRVGFSLAGVLARGGNGGVQLAASIGEPLSEAAGFENQNFSSCAVDGYASAIAAFESYYQFITVQGCQGKTVLETAAGANFIEFCNFFDCKASSAVVFSRSDGFTISQSVFSGNGASQLWGGSAAPFTITGCVIGKDQQVPAGGWVTGDVPNSVDVDNPSQIPISAASCTPASTSQGRTPQPTASAAEVVCNGGSYLVTGWQADRRQIYPPIGCSVHVYGCDFSSIAWDENGAAVCYASLTGSIDFQQSVFFDTGSEAGSSQGGAVWLFAPHFEFRDTCFSYNRARWGAFMYFGSPDAVSSASNLVSLSSFYCGGISASGTVAPSGRGGVYQADGDAPVNDPESLQNLNFTSSRVALWGATVCNYCPGVATAVDWATFVDCQCPNTVEFSTSRTTAGNWLHFRNFIDNQGTGFDARMISTVGGGFPIENCVLSNNFNNRMLMGRGGDVPYVLSGCIFAVDQDVPDRNLWVEGSTPNQFGVDNPATVPLMTPFCVHKLVASPTRSVRASKTPLPSDTPTASPSVGSNNRNALIAGTGGAVAVVVIVAVVGILLLLRHRMKAPRLIEGEIAGAPAGDRELAEPLTAQFQDPFVADALPVSAA